VSLDTLPKAELHTHLDGIITPEMLRAIRVAQPGYPVDPEALAAAYPVHDFESFVAWWRYKTPDVRAEFDLFRPVLAHHIAQLRRDNVRYAELLIPSGHLPRDPAAAVDTLAAFRAWTTTLEDGAIQVEFVLCHGRTSSAEVMAHKAAVTFATHAAGLIVGVALAGWPEAGYPVSQYGDLFRRFRDAGLGVEIHAGEWAGPESVWDALEHGHPHRIGHGVAAFRDPHLIETLLTRGIHIEMCPTCNVITGSVARLAEHPITQARALGLSFSINTDDPGPLLITLGSEYARVAEVFGFSEDDFRRIYANTLAARFAADLRVAP
jgi:adenosine deaminase